MKYTDTTKKPTKLKYPDITRSQWNTLEQTKTVKLDHHNQKTSWLLIRQWPLISYLDDSCVSWHIRSKVKDIPVSWCVVDISNPLALQVQFGILYSNSTVFRSHINLSPKTAKYLSMLHMLTTKGALDLYRRGGGGEEERERERTGQPRVAKKDVF